MCRNYVMMEIASEELEKNTRGLLQRVVEGEGFVVAADGHQVATLQSLNRRPRWVSGADFARPLDGHQADADLRDELRLLSPDSTDGLS